MAKLTISLEIKAEIEKDGGYYGIGETLEETLRLIKRDSRNYRVFVAKGAEEAKEVRAHVSIVGIAITNVDDIPTAD